MKRRLSTVELLVKMACFVKKNSYINKSSLLKESIQEDQPYIAFNASKNSLDKGYKQETLSEGVG